MNNISKNTQIEKNFELRERTLDLMEKNLESRENIYTPVKDTFIDKLSKWIKKVF